MWIVSVDTPPETFKPGFFPRAFRYKAEAERLAAEVRGAGGKPHVKRGNLVCSIPEGDVSEGFGYQ